MADKIFIFRHGDVQLIPTELSGDIYLATRNSEKQAEKAIAFINEKAGLPDRNSCLILTSRRIWAYQFSQIISDKMNPDIDERLTILADGAFMRFVFDQAEEILNGLPEKFKTVIIITHEEPMLSLANGIATRIAKITSADELKKTRAGKHNMGDGIFIDKKQKTVEYFSQFEIEKSKKGTT